jgi:hypothetical protein
MVPYRWTARPSGAPQQRAAGALEQFDAEIVRKRAQ